MADRHVRWSGGAAVRAVQEEMRGSRARGGGQHGARAGGKTPAQMVYCPGLARLKRRYDTKPLGGPLVSTRRWALVHPRLRPAAEASVERENLFPRPPSTPTRKRDKITEMTILPNFRTFDPRRLDRLVVVAVADIRETTATRANQPQSPCRLGPRHGDHILSISACGASSLLFRLGFGAFLRLLSPCRAARGVRTPDGEGDTAGDAVGDAAATTERQSQAEDEFPLGGGRRRRLPPPLRGRASFRNRRRILPPLRRPPLPIAGCSCGTGRVYAMSREMCRWRQSLLPRTRRSTATASTSPPVFLHILLFIVEIILVVHVEVFLEESTLVEERLRAPATAWPPPTRPPAASGPTRASKETHGLLGQIPAEVSVQSSMTRRAEGCLGRTRRVRGCHGGLSLLAAVSS